MPQPLNPHQPKRPDVHPVTKDRLWYRVAPITKDNGHQGGRIYRTCEISNRFCQMQLYRWCRGPDFVLYPGIGDLFQYLITDVNLPASKGHFGRTITNALDFNPRKLKGVTKDNPKAAQIYTFNSAEELQYGLEYQICAWLRHFLNDLAAPGSKPVSGHEMMQEELDLLASTPWNDYHQLYIQPMLDIDAKVIQEPDWRKLKKQASHLRPLEDEIESEPDIPAEPRGGIKSYD